MTFALWPQWQVPFPQLNVRVTVRNLSHYFSKQMSRFCQRVPDHPKKTLKQQAQWSSGTASLVKTAVNLVRAWKWKRWSETEKKCVFTPGLQSPFASLAITCILPLLSSHLTLPPCSLLPLNSFPLSALLLFSQGLLGRCTLCLSSRRRGERERNHL